MGDIGRTIRSCGFAERKYTRLIGREMGLGGGKKEPARENRLEIPLSSFLSLFSLPPTNISLFNSLCPEADYVESIEYCMPRSFE